MGGPDECWLWTGGRNPKGYGNVGHEGRHLSAHRVVWSLGACLPGHLHVLHRCDHPWCCNPAHMFLGTNRDNIDDRLHKGRLRKSDVLDADKVRAIRREYDPEVNTHDELALRFGVSPSSIGLILQKKSWSWVDPEWQPPDTRRGKKRFGNARADAIAGQCMERQEDTETWASH